MVRFNLWIDISACNVISIMVERKNVDVCGREMKIRAKAGSKCQIVDLPNTSSKADYLKT